MGVVSGELMMEGEVDIGNEIRVRGWWSDAVGVTRRRGGGGCCKRGGWWWGVRGESEEGGGNCFSGEKVTS
jgi:hypothetical protein